MPNNLTERVILSIDPGFDRVGLALMKQEDDKMVLLHSECIETSSKDPRQKRLLEIGLRVRTLIKERQPRELAIEKLFFNQNTSSALGVAEARGIIIFEAASAGLKVFEYSPQDIKIAVTSYGKADKKQVEEMARKLIKIPETGQKRLDDELDAIAVGITHLASERSI